MKQALKLIFELGPLGVFLYANNYHDIYIATAAFMIATAISLTGSWITFKKIATIPLVTGIFVMIFGGLTLYLNNDTFIKMKPTIVNVIFASILFGGLYFNRLFLKIVFEEAFQLIDEGWRKLTIRFGFFYLFLAILNEVVWRGSLLVYADPKDATIFWGNFKVLGLMPISMIFFIIQIGLIQKYMIEPESSSEEKAET